MQRIAPLAAWCALWLGPDSIAQVAMQADAGGPLPGLSPLERMLFDRGDKDFHDHLTPAQGLGPAFNRNSCVGCHETVGTFGGASTVLRFASDLSGTFDPLSNLGGPVMQANGISPTCMEFAGREDRLPSIANIRTRRVTPPLAGIGLLEAIPDASIQANTQLTTDHQRLGISGRVHWVRLLENPAAPVRAGRFGWKAQLATVTSFSADASLHEMGLTNEHLRHETAPEGNLQKLAECDLVADIEDHPDEIGLPFVDSITYFQRYLAAPPQSPRRGMRGETLFQQAGCALCHVPQYVTSNSGTLEPALRNQVIRPYSDFLLHDMGSLGDRMVDGDASGAEMKTPALWGLRDRPALLHDGSGVEDPRNVQEAPFSQRVRRAIGAHFGEANASRENFLRLSAADQAAMIAFLGSLGRQDFDINDDGQVNQFDYALIAPNALDPDVSPDEPWAVADLNSDRQIGADEMELLRARAGMPLDCNSNGIPDWRDIAGGASTDLNANGRPDECEDASCHFRSIRIAGTGGQILDNRTLTRTIQIPTRGIIRSIRVGLDMQHTWVLDLSVTLRRGNDAAISLMSRECGAQFSDDLNGVYRFEDDASWDGSMPATKLCTMVGRIDRGPGFSDDERFLIPPGNYQPFNPFSAALRNKQMQATWTLTVSDGRTTEVGELRSWWLEIRYEDTTAGADDCDGDGLKDCEQIDNDPSLDCNSNHQLDRCEIAANPALDRWPVGSPNGILDSCDIAADRIGDMDGNGVPDPLDPDSDGDGFPDSVDECPQNVNRVLAGDCGCGQQAEDDDSDGLPNCLDGCPNDPLKFAPGACGCGTPDTDSDRDGTLDCNDGCPNDPLKTNPGSCGCGTPDRDSDTDGVPDCNDGCPNDRSKVVPGACGCGTADSDSDSDGTPDCRDGCPNDPLKINPGSCGCNTSDTDGDGDGTPDCNDGCPSDPGKTSPGSCGCGKVDSPGCGQIAETDSDLDGTPDSRDGCPNDALKTAPGGCGCGVPDVDSDGDGAIDCIDGCPSDPNKTSPGSCGCGQADADLNGNGVPDCNDVFGATETVLREATAGPGANFGWYVGLSGNRAIVGSPLLTPGGQMTGAARVLRRNVDGSWTAEALLTPPDGRANDWFGGRVAIDGDVAVVGAPSAQRDVGALYVYRRNGLGAWLFEQKLQPPEVANFSRLGSAVAIQGDTIVGGAPFDKTEGTAQRGSVVVFRWTRSTGWTLSQRLTAGDGEHGDRFGHSVALRDGVLVVGAPYDDSGNDVDHGSIYVYARASMDATQWSFQRKLGSPNPRSGNLFGRDVGTDGATIVAGSPNEFGGAAYAFQFAPAGQPMAAMPLIAPDRDANDGFASIVAIDDGTIVVGCRTDDVDGAADAGSTRIFRRVGASWVHAGVLRATPAIAGDQMGWGVSIDGGRVLASAPGADAGGADAGAVLVFDLSPEDCDDDGVPDLDTDGDGLADCIDLDDDDDGVPDLTDGCPRDLLKVAPGSCGCGQPDSSADSDGDGIPDCTDNCPFAANPSQVDCNGDGVGDACDGAGDCNANGILDTCELATGALTDLNGDGTPDSCEATTFSVPSARFPTIQSALDAAPTSGPSIVLVGPGTYIGSVNTQGKAVRLHAVAGPAKTILDGSAVDNSLLICTSGEGPGTVISGFTFRRGTRGTQLYPDRPWRVGGGLFVKDSSPTIRDCVFENCRGEYGGGAYLLRSGSLVERCSFTANTAIYYGGGAQAFAGTVRFADCSFTENFCGIGGGGLHTVGGAIVVERCSIIDNIALDLGGGISWDSNFTNPSTVNAEIVVRQCTIDFNFAGVAGGGLRVWNGPPDRRAQLSSANICGNAPEETFGNITVSSDSVICVDCNRNGIPDSDDIAQAPSLDCNQNGLIDACEIATSAVPDRNDNGIPDSCESSTLFVPSEFGSIASAITAAVPGDTVWIEAGVYREQLNFGGKAITIRGAPGAVIDGSLATGPLLLAIAGEGPNSVVEGITFRAGRAGTMVGNPPIFQVGGGAHVDSASPTIRNCVFEECRTQYGAGAYMRRFTGLIEGCTFRLNNALEDGGGLQFFEGKAVVRNCVFEQNICSRNGGSVHVVLGGGHRFENCVFRGNRSLGGFGGGISWDGGIPSQPVAGLELVHCELVDNRAPNVCPDTTMSEGGGLFVGPETRNLPPAKITGGRFCENDPQDIKGRWIALEPVVFCAPTGRNCSGDLDGNCLTDFGDVNLTLLDFGPCVGCAADVNADGQVDFGDIALLLLDFGPCP